jgi:hypothetical protein
VVVVVVVVVVLLLLLLLLAAEATRLRRGIISAPYVARPTPSSAWSARRAR